MSLSAKDFSMNRSVGLDLGGWTAREKILTMRLNALENIRSHARTNGKTEKHRSFPKLCLNKLNGGRHTYTNLGLSDFPEYFLVPKHNNLFEMIDDHGKIQKRIL
jgi:hypothetical protein